jgi:glycosyltransferase involved in cell wall biosynthesis
VRLLYLADIRFPMERANGIQTIETCHALARRGVDVELVVRRSDERTDAECLRFFGLAPHPKLRLRRVRARGRVGFMARMMPSVLRSPPSTVSYTRDLVLADVLVKLARGPVVYEAHTVAAVFAEERQHLYDDARPPSARKLERLDARERRVWHGAAGAVAITNALREALADRHGARPDSVVAPDGCRVPESMPAPGHGRRVYYIGQLYPWKGVDVLVRAMCHVDDAELVVIGGLPPEPDLARVEALAAELGLEERVRFRGFVPPPELDAERLKADVLVVPNLDSTTARLYTSPLKLFEGMASGRPVVASDLPSIREVLRHEVNALLVKSGDASALGAAIARLLADRALAARLAARAFEDVKAYSWDARGARLERLFEGLARSG